MPYIKLNIPLKERLLLLFTGLISDEYLEGRSGNELVLRKSATSPPQHRSVGLITAERQLNEGLQAQEQAAPDLECERIIVPHFDAPKDKVRRSNIKTQGDES